MKESESTKKPAAKRVAAKRPTAHVIMPGDEPVRGRGKTSGHQSTRMPRWKALLWGLGLAAWVGGVMIASQVVVSFVIGLMVNADIFSIDILDQPVVQLIYNAVVTVVYLLATILLPWAVLKKKTTRDEMGLRDLPTWTDVLLGPIGLIVSLIMAAILSMIMQAILPGVDWEQAQDVGFNQLIGNAQMLEGFIALVVIAPIAEELVFRGWLYGKLRKNLRALPAIIIVSVLFGALHGQWNVAVTVGAMSVVMCLLRELTGTIYAGMLVHMLKNGVAFYMLYVAHMV